MDGGYFHSQTQTHRLRPPVDLFLWLDFCLFFSFLADVVSNCQGHFISNNDEQLPNNSCFQTLFEKKNISIDLRTTAFSPVFTVSWCPFLRTSSVDGDKTRGGWGSFPHHRMQRAIGWFFFLLFGVTRWLANRCYTRRCEPSRRHHRSFLQNQPVCFGISPDSLPSAPSPY